MEESKLNHRGKLQCPNHLYTGDYHFTWVQLMSHKSLYSPWNHSSTRLSLLIHTSTLHCLWRWRFTMVQHGQINQQGGEHMEYKMDQIQRGSATISAISQLCLLRGVTVHLLDLSFLNKKMQYLCVYMYLWKYVCGKLTGCNFHSFERIRTSVSLLSNSELNIEN